MHWQIGKGGGFHYFEAEQQNQALPVTVFLGGPPALILSAIAPLPEGCAGADAGVIACRGKIATVANPLGAIAIV